MLTIQEKKFSDLSLTQLYELLQLRSEVFVVEQDCVYQDVDGKDQKALHILGYQNERLVAYTRIFNKNDYLEEASIGRVVVAKEARQHSYGKEIMQASIEAVEKNYNTKTIVLSAQTYLKKFYNELGFFEVGAEYLEDGIPHIKMKRN